MTAIDLTQLKSFLGGYFHQDWCLDASEPDEIISLFIESRPTAHDIGKIIAQIHLYLDDKGEPDVHRGLLDELGCYYLPSADGITASDWLRHIADRLGQS